MINTQTNKTPDLVLPLQNQPQQQNAEIKASLSIRQKITFGIFVLLFVILIATVFALRFSVKQKGKNEMSSKTENKPAGEAVLQTTQNQEEQSKESTVQKLDLSKATILPPLNLEISNKFHHQTTASSMLDIKDEEKYSYMDSSVSLIESDQPENYVVKIKRNAYSGLFDRIAIIHAYKMNKWIKNRVQLIDLINVADHLEKSVSKFFWAKFCYYSILALIALGLIFLGIGLSNWAYKGQIHGKQVYFLNVTWPFVVSLALIPALIIFLSFLRLCVLHNYQDKIESQLSSINNQFEKRNLFWKVAKKCYYIELSLVAIVEPQDIQNQTENYQRLSKIIDKNYIQVIPDKNDSLDSIYIPQNSE